MNSRSLTFWMMLSCLWAIGACSQGSLSERDARLEQLRLQAEAKRRELQIVAGDYQGQSVQSNGTTHEVVVQLKIVDISTVVEGQPEPVMMPALAGSVTYYVGAVGSSEFFVYAIDKAGFNVNSNRTEIQASHPEYKELLVSLKKQDSELSGTWTAPSMALSGTMSVKRVGTI